MTSSFRTNHGHGVVADPTALWARLLLAEDYILANTAIKSNLHTHVWSEVVADGKKALSSVSDYSPQQVTARIKVPPVQK